MAGKGWLWILPYICSGIIWILHRKEKKCRFCLNFGRWPFMSYIYWIIVWNKWCFRAKHFAMYRRKKTQEEPEHLSRFPKPDQPLLISVQYFTNGSSVVNPKMYKDNKCVKNVDCVITTENNCGLGVGKRIKLTKQHIFIM